MELQLQSCEDGSHLVVHNDVMGFMELAELPESEKPQDSSFAAASRTPDDNGILPLMNDSGKDATEETMQSAENGVIDDERKRRVVEDNERLIMENEELKRKIEALEAASRRPIRRQRCVEAETEGATLPLECEVTEPVRDPGSAEGDVNTDGDDNRRKKVPSRRKRGRPCRSTSSKDGPPNDCTDTTSADANGQQTTPPARGRKKASRKSVLCKDCNKTFRTINSLKRHRTSRHSDTITKFACKECDRVFSDKNSLNRHLQVHTGYKPHLCNLCGKSFTQSGNLNRHMQRHSGEKQYKCTICPKSFTRKHKLTEHLDKHEKGLVGIPPPATPSVMCPYCTKLFGSEEALNCHQSSPDCEKHQKSLRPKPTEQELLSQGKRVHKCHLCGKIFTHPANLARHVKIHSGVKPHVCATCHRGFARAAELATHAVVHTGEKPWECDICRKRFSQRAHVYRHRRKHTGERSHLCHICKRSYVILADLIKHLDVHTSGKKTHKCEVCRLTFTSAKFLESHIQQSHMLNVNAKSSAPPVTTSYAQAPVSHAPVQHIVQSTVPVHSAHPNAVVAQDSSGYSLPQVVMTSTHPQGQQMHLHQQQQHHHHQQQQLQHQIIATQDSGLDGGGIANRYIYAPQMAPHTGHNFIAAPAYATTAPLPVLQFTEFPQVQVQQQNGNVSPMTLTNQVRHALDIAPE